MLSILSTTHLGPQLLELHNFFNVVNIRVVLEVTLCYFAVVVSPELYSSPIKSILVYYSRSVEYLVGTTANTTTVTLTFFSQNTYSFAVHFFSKLSTQIYQCSLRLWAYRSQFLLFILLTLCFDALGSDEEPLWEPIE